MSNFKNTRCISLDGSEAPMYLSGRDSIFTSHTELARNIRNAKISKMKWVFLNSERVVSFEYISSASIDMKSDLLIVVLHYSDHQYIRPRNAVVIDAGGAVHHQIKPPKYVDLPDMENSLERYPVEAISEVLEKNGRILIGLNFCYDQIERRYYDPTRQTWLERDQIYRQ